MSARLTCGPLEGRLHAFNLCRELSISEQASCHRHRSTKSKNRQSPPPRKGPGPEDPRQCESVGINSDRRGPWGMVAYGGGNE